MGGAAGYGKFNAFGLKDGQGKFVHQLNDLDSYFIQIKLKEISEKSKVTAKDYQINLPTCKIDLK